MGLLDSITSSSIDDPKSQAVLGLAMGLLSGRGSDGFAKGIQGAMQGYQNAKQSKWQDELMQFKRNEMDAQTKARERQSMLEGLIRQQFSPISGTQAIQSDAFGPTAEKAQNIGQMPSVNWQQLAAAGVPMERLKALAEAPNLGRSKVARTVKGVGPDGREYEYQVDEFGQKVGDGLAQFRAPLMQDLGGKVQALDAYNLKPLAQFDKTMTPDGQASNAVAWANNALSRQRLGFDMAGGAEAVNGGKPQFKDGNWVMPPRSMQPGTSMPAMPQAGAKDANEALALIEQAKKVIPQATGSGVGAGIDWLGRQVGMSTKGDLATGQLQALEGALVAKMPKMSGPQSDKDVALYKQMAGVIGDPTIPVERKLAALQTVEEIQRRYAGATMPMMPKPGAMGSGSFKILSVE